MSILIRLLAFYYRTGIRGSYRLTDYLAMYFKSLHCVSIDTQSGTLFADLRISSSRGILTNPNSQSGEQLVMENFVNVGDTVFDIGAHLGFYTLILSRLVGVSGRVCAFEPNPELLPSLRRTVTPLTNVTLFPIALSDKAGEIKLFVPEDASMASLRDWTNGVVGDVHEVVCKMDVLDELVRKKEIPAPVFIKCDVEGAELSVFKGAVGMLNRSDAPVLLFEMNTKAASAFGSTTTAYFDFLEALDQPNYVFFEVTKDGLRDLSSREIEYTNVLAVPAAIYELHRENLPI